MKARIGIPRLGIYSGITRRIFESSGFDVIMPAKITKEMVKLGVMNSSDMMCFPYKATLGQHIWCLENGAADLVMWDNQGLCRQKHYFDLQEITLRKLGYKFKMHSFTAENALAKATAITGRSDDYLVSMATDIFNQILNVEQSAYFSKENGSLKVGIIGEIYTILEHDINFDLVRRLQRLDVDVDVSIKISDFIRHNFLGEKEKEEEQEEATKLLTSEIGGHGFDSICNTIWYGKNGFDGVIHLMPLSCMPEVTVEPLVDHVADKYGLPLYRFPIDENNFEAGFQTRLETFISMLRRRKR